MERHTNPKNSEIEVILTPYFEERIKSLPEEIIKREYARRLLCDINQLVEAEEVKQWIDDEYPEFNYQEDSKLVKFVQKIGVLINDEIRKICFSMIEEHPTIFDLDTIIILEELPKI
ncbi:TPA: hypothetical protein ACGOXF_002314, partial [Streptococcus suis]